MKQALVSLVVSVTLSLSLSACGDDSGDDGGSAGSSGSSQAGSTSGGSGGTGAAGAQSQSGSGGSSAAGTGSGGSASANVCSPGETIPAAFLYPEFIQNCGFDGKGELEGVEGFFRSIKLEQPLAPGDTFSFSVAVGKLAAGPMELWGGSAECGEAHEKLATVETNGDDDQVVCLTAAPKTGTYPYLIWYYKAAGAHGDVTFCPGVACPSP